MKKIITPSVLLVLLGFFSISYAGTITPEAAGKFIGKHETVCGKVVGAFYAAHAKGQPTLLDLDRFSRSRIFTVLIWGENRKKFEKPPEIFFRGKEICVTGMIKSYRGRPEIMVRDPSQVQTKGSPEVEPPK